MSDKDRYESATVKSVLSLPEMIEVYLEGIRLSVRFAIPNYGSELLDPSGSQIPIRDKWVYVVQNESTIIASDMMGSDTLWTWLTRVKKDRILYPFISFNAAQVLNATTMKLTGNNRAIVFEHGSVPGGIKVIFDYEGASVQRATLLDRIIIPYFVTLIANDGRMKVGQMVEDEQ